MKNYVCPMCGKMLKFFQLSDEHGRPAEEWRCNKCKKELFLVFNEKDEIIKELSCWTDYNGYYRISLVEFRNYIIKKTGR